MSQKHNSLLKERKTIKTMVELYCLGNHAESKGKLCPDCAELLEYAMKRLDQCPFGEKKGTCAKCEIHCYKTEMRKTVTKVMRYSGPRMLTRHPLLAIEHLIKARKNNPAKNKDQ